MTELGISTRFKHRCAAVSQLLKNRNESFAAIQGTTVIALHYRNGVLVAADRRCTMGGYIFNDYETKIYEASDFSLLGAAGVVSGIQLIADTLNERISLWQNAVKIFLEIEAHAQILKNILLESIEYALFLDFIVIPVLAGWSPTRRKGSLYSFDIGGGKFAHDSAIAIGSGTVSAQAILDAKWRAGFSRDEAATLAIEALYYSAGRNVFVSPALQSTPTVRGIEENGIWSLEDALIDKIAYAVYETQQRRGGKTVRLALPQPPKKGARKEAKK